MTWAMGSRPARPAAPAALDPSGQRAGEGWLSRLEWLDQVGSTNDVVLGWLQAGEPEVAVAFADEQTAGRGRVGRAWTAPPGAALLGSLGFRPTWIAPLHGWRLGAIVSLAMAEAAEATAGLEPGTIRLKWPNDLVAAIPDGGLGKLAGVLGETEGLGGERPLAVVGIGINVGWRRADFPPDLAAGMTSLAEQSGGRPIRRTALADAFLGALGPRVAALRAGTFEAAAWQARQLTDGELVRLERPDGTVELVRAAGVDPESGALLVDDRDGRSAGGSARLVHAGEIRHVRLGPGVADLRSPRGRGV
jgi:BirA family transcriptional regulator, biotin operon repressor / biotin---[acetyl-CoA-carboxylase] ligase